MDFILLQTLRRPSAVAQCGKNSGPGHFVNKMSRANASKTAATIENQRADFAIGW
jgi:hypothetical protein